MARLVPLCLLAAFVAGCGGSGGGTTSAPNYVSGHFGGTWTCAAEKTSGTCNLLLLTTGEIIGTITQTSLGSIQANFNGQMNGNQCTGWFLFPGGTTNNYTGTVTVSATAPYTVTMSVTSVEHPSDNYIYVLKQQSTL